MPPRIVSLLPSTTEIAAALGFAGALVGRSHECDHPPGVERLPVLTAPKLNPEGASGDIHREVSELLRRALSVYKVAPERLRALQPDVILTQSQCEVCAVSEPDVVRAVSDWTGARPRVVSVSPTDLEGVWAGIHQVARALDVSERGGAVVAALRERVAAVARCAAALPERPRVACVEWIDPPMAAGNWVPELVELAGGENLFGEAGAHAPWLALERLIEADPDVVVMMPCGFGLARTRHELEARRDREPWRSLRAVRQGRVVLADGHQYFNRPGPRLADSLEILAQVLHPEAFPPAHEGPGWQRWC